MISCVIMVRSFSPLRGRGVFNKRYVIIRIQGL
nr:MAG TPA: hypothetical protein [Inoviridae sp.]